MNLYRYVGNGPTNATDPSGLKRRPAGTKFIRMDWWVSEAYTVDGVSECLFNEVYFDGSMNQLGRSGIASSSAFLGNLGVGTAWIDVDTGLLAHEPKNAKHKSTLPETNSLGTEELRRNYGKLPGELTDAGKEIGGYALKEAEFFVPGPEELAFVALWKLVGRRGFGYIMRGGKVLLTKAGRVLRGRGAAIAAHEVAEAGKSLRAGGAAGCAPNIGPTHGHHADPKFMGGDAKQPLTDVPVPGHKQLHKDLNNFLRNKTDNVGNHMRPQRGNSGARIRDNFTRQERLDAMAEFYRQFRDKYPDSAREFFKQHPGLE